MLMLRICKYMSVRVLSVTSIKDYQNVKTQNKSPCLLPKDSRDVATGLQSRMPYSMLTRIAKVLVLHICLVPKAREDIEV